MFRRSRKSEVVIDCVNMSTVVDGTSFERWMQAQQVQIDTEFGAEWDTIARIGSSQIETMPASAWKFLLADNSDVVSALGYHDDVKGPNGKPLAKAFAKTDLQTGNNWTVTASHEVLETLADPDINRTVNTDGRVFGGRGLICVAYEVCFTGDTHIALLDGTNPTIGELVGRDEFWVYSTTEDGHVRPGHAHSARLTRRNADLLKVTLDNGEEIRCTPDHLFRLRDGSYLPAVLLAPGTSLMPLYRRLEPVAAGGNPYEQVFDPAQDDWLFTHRVVEARCPQGYVRHHKDFNRFNNDPRNIELLLWEDHQRLHAEHVVEATRGWTEWAIARGVHPFQQPKSEAHRQGSRERITAYNRSEEHRQIVIETNRRYPMWDNPLFVERHRESSRERMAAANHRRWHEDRGVVKPDCSYCVVVNHKVVAVEPCGREDVYDFTVDKYHNFALAAGVFVHNCDACEADQFAKAFRVGGKKGVDIMLSDFVTRAWFEDAQGAAVDAYGHLTAPWQIGPRGYIGIYVPGRGWTQAFSNQLGDPAKLVMARRQLASMAVDNGIRHPELEDSPRRKARFAEEIAL